MSANHNKNSSLRKDKMACSKLVTELLLKTVYIQYWLKAVKQKRGGGKTYYISAFLFENNSPNYAAAVATAAATVATARATTVTTAMVAIHWDGAQRVVIKTAWMMPTRKRDDAYRDTCQSLCVVFFTLDRRQVNKLPPQGTTQTQGSVFGSTVETKSCKIMKLWVNYNGIALRITASDHLGC